MSLSAPLTRCAAIFKELSMLLKVSSHRPAERYRELPNVDVTVSSQYSPDLAEALMRGKLDVAFLRPETHACQAPIRRLSREILPWFQSLPRWDGWFRFESR